MPFIQSPEVVGIINLLFFEMIQLVDHFEMP